MNPVREGLDRTGLYHSIRLPNGRVLEGANPLDYLEERWASFGLPADLHGLKALDIGPWDGYFTFELERHGAEVTAIDYVDLDTFRKLHALTGSRAKYLQLDAYDIRRDLVGEFDIVLFLGVLYHLKHPLLALERICTVTRGFCIVDTYAIDTEAYRAGQSSPIPYAEFYERGELGGQLDNWCGPTVSQVQAWVRAAGFASATVLSLTATTVRVRADRHWRDLPPVTAEPLVLHGVNSPAHGGRCFRSDGEDYLVFWCQWNSDKAPDLESAYPEVDGYGLAPIFAQATPNGLMITTRLPPGLSPGKHDARLRIGGSGWSNVEAIYVDLEPATGTLSVEGIQDAITFVPHVDWAQGGWVTLWVSGLTELADVGNIKVEIDGIPHRPHAVTRDQLNLQLRPLFEAGIHRVVVEHRGLRSAAQDFTLRGECPAIKGIA